MRGPSGRTARLAGIGLAAGVAGCGLFTEPAGHLDLSLRLSTTEVHADTGVLVSVAAVNHNRYPLNLETTGGCVVSFRLIGPDGAPFQRSTGFGCTSILRRVTIPEGDSVAYGFFLLPGRPGRGARWPSGTYQVIGQLLGHDLEVLDETAPQEFHLTCRDPAWPEC